MSKLFNMEKLFSSTEDDDINVSTDIKVEDDKEDCTKEDCTIVVITEDDDNDIDIDIDTDIDELRAIISDIRSLETTITVVKKYGYHRCVYDLLSISLQDQEVKERIGMESFKEIDIDDLIYAKEGLLTKLKEKLSGFMDKFSHTLNAGMFRIKNFYEEASEYAKKVKKATLDKDKADSKSFLLTYRKSLEVLRVSIAKAFKIEQLMAIIKQFEEKAKHIDPDSEEYRKLVALTNKRISGLAQELAVAFRPLGTKVTLDEKPEGLNRVKFKTGLSTIGEIQHIPKVGKFSEFGYTQQFLTDVKFIDQLMNSSLTAKNKFDATFKIFVLAFLPTAIISDILDLIDDTRVAYRQLYLASSDYCVLFIRAQKAYLKCSR